MASSFKPLLLSSKHKRPICQIHALLITTCLFADTIGHLIASYARIGDLTFARYVFDKLPERGLDVWNSMIIAYSRKNYSNEVLKLYHRMITEGIRPDSSTFTVAIKACSSLMDLEAGEDIWCEAVGFGYQRDVFVGSSVLNLYAKCGKMDQAKEVFDNMAKRDVVSWTTMITGLVQSGQAIEAVNMYRRMQKKGVKADMFVMVGLIKACASLGDVKMGRSVHGYIVRKMMGLDGVVVQTSLVDMYAKNGHLELASLVFKEMPCKNDISWSALISGFTQNGFAGNVLELLVEMQRLGFKPNQVCLMNALLACPCAGSLKLGRSIHGYIVRSLYEMSEVLGTSLIDMYAKCGALCCARALFDQIESRDLVLWNAIIASYGIHGHGKEALSLFLKMRETNVKPDHLTFASLFSAFSHSGLVEEGLYWFDIMVNECKIQPSEKHYACMVDLLSRAGQVDEAYWLIESMNTNPGLTLWVALLSGCHNYGKFLVGDRAARKILDLNPNDLGIYALVANFFAMAGKWYEVALTKIIMKNKGSWKVPAYSAVEVNGKHRTFLTLDKNHHQHQDIAQILDTLNNEMKPITYVSDSNIM